MKKILLWILLISVMITTIGCEIQEPSNGTVDNMVSSEETDKKEDTEKSELSSIESDFVTETESEILETEIEYNERWEEHDIYDLFSFQSPERLNLALINDKRGFDVRQNLENSSEEYIDLLDKFENGELILKYPIIEGYNESFLTQDILLFSSHQFSLPNIWYRKRYDNEIIIVSIIYMEEELFDFSKSHTVADVLDYISPGFPTTDNAYMYGDKFVEISEQIVTGAECEFNVLIRKTESRVYIHYIFENMLVQITGSSSDDVYPELVSKIRFVEVD